MSVPSIPRRRACNGSPGPRTRPKAQRRAFSCWRRGSRILCVISTTCLRQRWSGSVSPSFAMGSGRVGGSTRRSSRSPNLIPM
ncbi:hypothetical protein ACFFX0_20595 [Citricoccus parietis]|uniref:Uncharacterized protein n=1 Tax=Citricoccus parietis TaxID=592307 RepID=A0ABV5G3F6_9MICC